MKIKFLPLIVGLCSTVWMLTSCLNDDVEEITYSSNTSITGFSIGTLHIEKTGIAKDGSDSIFTDTIDCSKYPFTIDQLNRTIENKDSLPVGTDVTKVLTNITADTYYIYYEKPDGSNVKDTLWTNTDSIDFTRPVIFKVLAYSGVVGKSYQVKVNVHKQVPDSLQWNFVTNKFDQGIKLQRQKAVYAANHIYVFGQNTAGETVIQWSSVSNGSSSAWQTLPVEVSGIDSYSATSWQGAVYFVAGKQLYRIDPSTNNCTPVTTDAAISQLIVGGDVLYAFNDQQQSGYLSDTYQWTTDTEAETLKPLAGNRISATAFPVEYNTSIKRVVALSHNNGTAEADTTAIVANRLSIENTWNIYTPNTPVVCPNLKNISMIYYDKKLYAFGGGNANGTIKPFEALYCSIDNGLSWRKETRNIIFPKKVSDSNPNLKPFAQYYTEGEGTYSCTVDQDNFIWIIWEDGSICRGRINRLGFASKW